jgi:hypothetical protein
LTVTFDDLSNPNRTLGGQYPSGLIDWGSNAWYLSGPFGAFRTQSVSFNSAAMTSASFTLLSPRRLVQIDAYNGGPSSSAVSLSCAGQPIVNATLAAHQLVTIATNWSGTCASVQLTSSNGWDTNFDNLVLASGAQATPTPTQTPTSPPAARTVTFDDLSSPNRPLSGQYPGGAIDWGTNAWFLSGAYGAFRTNSVSFNGRGPTSATFRLLTAQRLVQIDVYNGGASPSTVSLACSGQPTITMNVAARQQVTIATGWVSVCATVTVGSTNGWDTNFDNLVAQP